MKIKKSLSPVSSEVFSFVVAKDADLVPPVLQSPVSTQTVPFQKAQTGGVYFSWKPLDGIQKYKISIFKLQKIQEKERYKLTHTAVVEGNIYKWQEIHSGLFRWTVQSMNSQSKLSVAAKLIDFNIGDIPEVLWVTGPEKSRYQYTTETPSILVNCEDPSKELPVGEFAQP